MARLRFPGRPGHRFDRASVRYFADDVKNISDPAIAFLPQFKRGLLLFRELVGESEEDEDFEGFSLEDVFVAEKKLQKHKHEEKEGQAIPLEASSPTDTLGTRLKSARQSLDNLPAAERTRGKNKMLIRKSYKEMIAKGLSSPSKTHEIMKSKDIISPDDKLKKQKAKSHTAKPFHFKLDQKYEASGGRVKKADKDMAKFLLEKAKQAQKLAQQKRERSNKTQVQRREFVLPTQSSRSSRVIIPNKRFLEDDSVHSVVKKKKIPEVRKESKTPRMTGNHSIADKNQHEKHTGLLDQPLIMDGKRERKKSLKLRQKSSEFGLWENYEDFKDIKQISPLKPIKTITSPSHTVVVSSPLAAPKLGTSLFSQSGSQFQKASEQQRLGMMGLAASRKKGASIVQKAKLKLNRDALNKSKAALAKSLKAKMKREAKIEESHQLSGVCSKLPETGQEEDGTPRPDAVEKKRKPKKQCAICRTRENLATAGSTLACLACRDFFWRVRKFIGVNEFICRKGTGTCMFSPTSRASCRACRMKKCLESGMLKGETLPKIKKLFYKNYIVSGGDKTHSDDQSVTISVEVPAVGPSSPKRLKTETTGTIDTLEKVKSPVEDKVKLKLASLPTIQPKPTSDHVGKLESVIHIPGETTDDISIPDSPLKSRSLSGELREHKRKKQKAFKELLRAKQERSENLLALPEPAGSAAVLVSPSETTNIKISPTSVGKGPRIKHVCRNADMVLGKPQAKFPSVSEIRLSALPAKEKVQLWKKEEAEKAAKVESDDERPIEEIIQQSSDNVCIVKKSPAHSARETKKKTHHPALKGYKRKTRCKKCRGCLAEACGKCRNCLDMPRFGGSGVLKQACVKRKCTNPMIRRGATEAFLELKNDNSGTDSNAGSTSSSPRKQTSADTLKSARELTDPTDVSLMGAFSLPRVNFINTVNTAGLEVRRLNIGRVPVVNASPEGNSHRPPFRSQPGKINSKRLKVDIQGKYAKKMDSVNGEFYPVSLQSVIPASRHWGTSLTRPDNHLIKVDFKGSCSLGMLWKQGMALTLAGSICVRTLCYLCGSAGKHELIYCNVCCEPFHEFCLDEEVPSGSHLDDWVCPRCQFCHVCGRQNNLLQCDKCHDMYHPECLGPNYPTKPSRKKRIWICTKCVKCKSCGATTPGSASHATWTYDFSLCYECGQLMDKGNFCPICRKCYSDDDWESKMVQCGMCESWVHAKCEGLSDEMYEILSYMPEDLSFNCRKCFPVGCPEWEMTLKRELRNGLENVLQTLILSKCSQYIYKYAKKKSPLKLNNKSTGHVENNSNSEKSGLDIDNTGTKDINVTCVVTSDRTHLEDNSDANIQTDTVDTGISGTKSGGDSESYQKKFNSDTEPCVDETSDNKTAMLDRAENEISDTDKDLRNLGVENELPAIESNRLQCCELFDKRRTDSIVPCIVTEANTGCSSITGNTNNANEMCKSHKTGSEESKTGKLCDNFSFTCKGQTADHNVCDNGNSMTSIPQKVDSETCMPSTATVSSSSGNGGDSVGTCPLDVPHSPTDTVGEKRDQIGMTSDIISADNDQRPEDKDGSPTQSAAGTVHMESASKGEDKVSEGPDKGVGNAEQDSEKKVDALKGSGSSHHVHFFEEIQTKVEAPHPKDLAEIRDKMTEGVYTSVALFSEDIMRIIQEYLDNSEETRCTRKKAVNSARSIFVKQMERVFPWYNVKTCRYWYSNKDFPRGMLPDATLPPSRDHTYAQWLEREEIPLSPQPSPFKKVIATPVKKLQSLDDEDGEAQTAVDGEDTRKCILCHRYGDQEPNYEGRLLYCGQDDWVHVNCALWSAEVYEDTDGSLQNLKEAYSRGKMLKCEYCQRAGATVGCNTRGCIANYHFMCARKDNCAFQVDKKIFCKAHRDHVDKEVLSEDKFHVVRRVFVRNLFVRAVKKFWANGLNSADISIMIGSCTVECLGKLTDLSDRPRFLVPVNYMCTRVYWSTKDARRRCVYTCTVKEVHPEALKSPTVPIKDMRIIHDEADPEYVPLSELNLTEMGIAICNKEATLVKANDTNIVDLTKTNEEPDFVYMDTTGETTLEAGPLSASFGGRDCDKIVEARSLSESWPGAKVSLSEKQNSTRYCTNTIDLTVLSSETRKLLNIKNITNCSNETATAKEENDDMGLLKIADRLNKAAAKSRQCGNSKHLISRPSSNRSSRSPSVEPQDGTRPFSPPDRISSPSFDSSLKTRPFSPPVRMLSKSRSPSLEKTGSVSLAPSFESQNLARPFSPLTRIRSPSFDGTLRTRPFSPPIRISSKSGSPSFERTGPPVPLLSSTVIGTPVSDARTIRASSEGKIANEKPFSPPCRLLSISPSPTATKTNVPKSLLSSKASESSDSRNSICTSVELMNCERACSVPSAIFGSCHSPSLGICVSPVTGQSSMISEALLDKQKSVSSSITHLSYVDLLPPNSKPLSASSPVRHKAKSDQTLNEKTETDNDCFIVDSNLPFTSSSNNSGSENFDQSGDSALVENKSSENFDQRVASAVSVNTSQKDLRSVEENFVEGDTMTEEATETFVIMTDSCEEISEEEAIFIAQAAVEHNNSSEKVKDLKNEMENDLREERHTCETRNEIFPELQESKKEENGQREEPAFPMERYDDEVKNDSQVSINSDSSFDSPFVPKIAENDNCKYLHVKQHIISNVKLKNTLANEENVSIDCASRREQHKKMNVSLNSYSKTNSDDSDSEIVDITDSIVKAGTTVSLSEQQNLSVTMSKTDTDCEIIDSDVEIIDNICSNQIQNTERGAEKIAKTVTEAKDLVEEIKGNEKRSNVDQLKDAIEIEKCESLQKEKEVRRIKEPAELELVENKFCVPINTRAVEKILSKEVGIGTLEKEISNSSGHSKEELCESALEVRSDKFDSVSKIEKQNMLKFTVGKEECMEKEHAYVNTYEENTEIDATMQSAVDKNNSRGEKDGGKSSGFDFFSAKKADTRGGKEKLDRTTATDSYLIDSLHVDIVQNEDCVIDNLSPPVITITPGKIGSPDSQDKNIFDQMKEFSLHPDVPTVKNDKRSEAEKHEVLRGLGLERSEDVEKARNSTKSSKSPLKTYPLRKNMMSPARYRDADDLLVTTKLCLRGKQIREAEGKARHSVLPVLDPIAKKIKLESLAKSNADDKGPFRCQMCKRSYRTEASLKLHADKCDFEVSTSDDDDNETQNGSYNPAKNSNTESMPDSSASARSSLRKSTIVQRVALEVEEKRIKEEGATLKRRGRPSLSRGSSKQDVADCYLESRSFLRHSVRKYTARASSPLVMSRGRGRQSKKRTLQHCPDTVKRGPGRPRKYSAEKNNERKINIKNNLKQLTSRDRLSFHKTQSALLAKARNSLKQKLLKKLNNAKEERNIDLKNSNLSQIAEKNTTEANGVGTSCFKRGRGRPRKFDKSFSVIDEKAALGPKGKNAGDLKMFSEGNETANTIIKLKKGRRRKALTSIEEKIKHEFEEVSSSENRDSVSDHSVASNLSCKSTVDGNIKDTKTSNPGHRYYGRGRQKIFKNSESNKLVSGKVNPGSSGEENASDSEEETTSGSIERNSGHNTKNNGSETEAPRLKRGRGRPRKGISPEENEPELSSVVLKNRDVPSLKEEVENFRRIKRLKRENSLEKVKHDGIELQRSSDEEMEHVEERQNEKDNPVQVTEKIDGQDRVRTGKTLIADRININIKRQIQESQNALMSNKMGDYADTENNYGEGRNCEKEDNNLKQTKDGFDTTYGTEKADFMSEFDLSKKHEMGSCGLIKKGDCVTALEKSRTVSKNGNGKKLSEHQIEHNCDISENTIVNQKGSEREMGNIICKNGANDNDGDKGKQTVEQKAWNIGCDGKESKDSVFASKDTVDNRLIQDEKLSLRKSDNLDNIDSIEACGDNKYTSDNPTSSTSHQKIKEQETKESNNNNNNPLAIHSEKLPSACTSSSPSSVAGAGLLKSHSETGTKSSLSVASGSNLSNTVLKLLKEGHKVLIKNPKLGKSFLWEKTETGYVGRPYEPKHIVKSTNSLMHPYLSDDSKKLKEGLTTASQSGNKDRNQEELVSDMKLPSDNTFDQQKTDEAMVGGATKNDESKSTSSSLQQLMKIAKGIGEKFENGPACISKKHPIQQLSEPGEKSGLIPVTVSKEVNIQQSADLDRKGGLIPTFLNKESDHQNSAVVQLLTRKLAEARSMNNQTEKAPPHTVINQIVGDKGTLEHESSIPVSEIAVSLSPKTSVEYLGGLVLSSTGSISLVTQSPTQFSSLSTTSVSLWPSVQNVQSVYTPTRFTNIQSRPPLGSPVFQIFQSGIPRIPVANLLSQTTYTQNNSPQIASGPSVLPYSPHIVAPQQQNNVQPVAYLTQQCPRMSSPQTGLLSGTVLQSSSAIFQPLLPNLLSAAVSVTASAQNAFGDTQCVTSSSQTVGFSAKNSDTVAKDVADIVKNLQKHSHVQLPHGSGSSLGTSDSVMSLGKDNSGKSQLESQHQFSATIKPQESSNIYYNKIRQILAKKSLTPKSALYRHKRQATNRPTVCFQEMKDGIVQGQFKGNVRETNSSVRLEKVSHSVFPQLKKKPYKKLAGNLSPLKKRGRHGGSSGAGGSGRRRKSPLRARQIEGPHSLGSCSHPIIHAQKEVTSLPAAAVEEEVVETPLDALYDQLDSGQQGGSRSRDNRGHLEFEITSDDGFTCKSDTIDGAWRQVIDKVQDARTASRLKQLSYGGLNGLYLGGLSHTNTVYLAEQLYGAGYCHTYKFRYHSHELRRHEEPPENPSGCIRTEPFDGRKPYDMFSFLMSRYRVRPETSPRTGDNEMILKSSRRATSMDLPMAMRFRKLREHSREAVGVYRSRIHGRGLFCKRSIDGGEMIIEYAGEVIRGSLTDIREKYYESKGIGCYMFRIDDTDVVDATMKGSAARFINHSCEPNCYSKVITVDNRKHIVIFAIRPIERGEELTYDYKFPIEDVKIPCTCGSRRCRKYLN